MESVLGCKVKKETAEQFKSYCVARNESVSSAIGRFVTGCLNEDIPKQPVKLLTTPAEATVCEITIPDAQTANSGAGASKETDSCGGILTEYAMSKAKKAIGRTGEKLPEFFERAAYKTEKNDRTTSLLGDPVKAYRADREREENPQPLRPSAQNEKLKTDKESIFDLVQQVKEEFKQK